MESPAERVEDPRTAAFSTAIADRYVVDREIGRGGMSRIYLAHDIRHWRAVALKVLPPDIATSHGRALFLREIRIAAQLSHPNILPLHDSGEAAGRLFFVMPFVEERTLRDVLRDRGALSLPNVVSIVREIADALDFAHAHGVVHRDIKPANILFVAGHPVLADFGIAQAISAAHDETATASEPIVGTPAYMSPEQASAGEVDRRSDVYALGVVLEEMLTGRRAGGEVPLDAVQRANGTTSPNVRRKLPSRVRRVIDRACSRNPDDRFATAGAFAAALAAASRPPERIVWYVAPPLVAAFTAAVWFIARETTPAIPLQARRVVVAEFENPARRPELNYIGSMVADWATEGLERTGFVDAVPTLTSLAASRFAHNQRDPLQALAQETGAAIVVTGSAYLQDGEIEMQVQVSDASKHKLLGTIGPIRGPASSPTVAIDAVRTRLMGLLSSTFDSRLAASLEIPQRPPTFEAYLDFSQAMEDYLASRFPQAADRFSRAFDRDTTFATALLMASIARSNAASYAAADSLLDRLAPERSQLTPIDREWFDYRRHLVAGERAAALASVRRIAAAAPGTKATYNLAVEAMQNGALAEAKTAIESLSPDHGPMRGWAPYWDVRTRIRHMLGEHRAELRDAQEAQRRFPTRLYTMSALVRALGALGRTSELRKVLDHAASLPADPSGVTPADLALEGGTELLAHGRASDASRVLNDGLTWLQSFAAAHPVGLDQRLARARLRYALGDWRTAADSAAALAREAPTRSDILGVAGAAVARAGDHVYARQLLGSIAGLPRPYDMGIVSQNVARVLMSLGMRDSAIAMLRRSAEEGHEFDVWAHRDVDFAPLRGDTAFANAVRPRPR